jgi:hypothetical protein
MSCSKLDKSFLNAEIAERAEMFKEGSGVLDKRSDYPLPFTAFSDVIKTVSPDIDRINVDKTNPIFERRNRYAILHRS